ncbi:IS30 family transposase [Polynucleobacter sp. TUM22923]|nr:IS30 family transposase [Polynucleobacter sp. TUM22923]
MTYQHLSQEERYQIYILMKDGKTQSQIAQLMNRHKSTIGRELSRNTGGRGYRPRQACLLAEERSLGSRNATQITPADWDQTVEYLQDQWSPEQIADVVGISHETIYRHVYADKAAGGTLYQQLRCQKKRKKRYASGRDRRGQIVGRRPISERPEHIEARSQVGHWEGDTVIGAAHKQAIVTLVERKSGYAVLAKVPNKTSTLVGNAIIEGLAPYQAKVKTLTYDNGKEFAEHARIDTALQSTTYFADPFASWQRGSNENFNGLLRQYIPKKEAFIHRN